MDKTSEDRINEMIEGVMKVARGDYSVQIELSDKNDDFDSLALGINMMIDDVRHEINKRTRLEKEEQRQAVQAELIYKVGQRVSGELELKAVLSEIVSAVRDAFDYPHVMLIMVDEETRHQAVQSIVGAYADYFPKEGLMLPIGEGMTGHAVATGKTQVSGDVSQDPHYVRDVKETKSELAVPIKSGKKVIGVLDIQSDKFDAFDKIEVNAMETLSTQISTAVENARLYEQAQQEITERKQAQKVLKQQASFVNNNPAPVLQAGYDGNIIQFNPAAKELFKKDITGKSIYNILSEIKELSAKKIKINKSFQIEQIIGEKTFLFSINRDKPTHSLYIYGADITQAKKAQQKIQEQNEYLNTIIESLAHPFYVIDANDYTIKLANSAAYAGDLSKKITCFALTHKCKKPCGGSEHLCPLEDVKKTKKPVVVEHVHYVDGNPRVFEVHGFPVFDSKGNVVQMIEYSLDITERKQAENEKERILHSLQERYKELNGLYGINEISRREGITIREVFKEIIRLIPPSWQYPEITGGCITFKGKEYKTRNFKKTKWMQRADIIVNNEKAGLIEVCYLEERPERDGDPFLKEERNLINAIAERLGQIIEQKLAEELLKKLSSAIEQTADQVVITDKEGVIEYVNPAFEKLSSYTKEEAIGKTPRILKSGKHKKSIYKELWETILSGRFYRYVFINKKKGGELYYEEKTITPIKDAQGNITHFVSTGRDITGRKQAEEALRQAKKEAETATRAKSEFLANMSHEIRTPLNGIFGMTELALNTKLAPEQREYLEAIMTSAESLMQIIDDILDFSRIEAKKIELEPIRFNLRDSIGDMLSSLALQAHNKGLELAYYIPQDIPDVLIGDPGRLRQIIINLTNNAIKFTEKGEVVVKTKEVSQTKDKITLHFAVTDTGGGIPKAKQRLIFDAFTQADGSMARKHGGTGLGLAISQQLVELMGGRIWVESTAGKGSTFHFTVRLGLQRGKIEELIAAKPEDLKDLPVLVVDDNSTNRLILKKMLTNWQMKPTAVESGRKALAAVEQAMKAGKLYSLFLIDSRMPEMDGFTLAKKIKDNPNLAGASMVMLTSAGVRGDAARCQKLGISAYLTKPIKQSELLDAIMLVLGISPKAKERVPLITRHTIKECRLRLRILLAEDNIINQKVAVHILEKYGHKVFVANNGQEVLQALKKDRFDLILMDVQMPKMDGFEATASIREKEKKTGFHIPIIAMTAHAMKGDRERCLDSGMDDYIAKPLKAEHLTKTIDLVISKIKKRKKTAD